MVRQKKHCSKLMKNINALPFEHDERKLFKIGVNFTSATRNIEKWMVEAE